MRHIAIFQTKMFTRYTDSAKRAVFYAMKGSVARGSNQITPEDLLLGLARDRHHEECSFRFLQEKHDALALAVGLVWPSSEELLLKDNPPQKPPLSAASKRVLVHASREADEANQFWIDTDNLLAGLLLEGGAAAAALESIGYTLESTRLQGAEGRRRWPPKKPTLSRRLNVSPHVLWLLVGVIGGVLIVNLYNYSQSR